MTEPVAPQGALAKELEQVAHSAADLRAALAKPQKELPADFPKGDLDAVAATLERVPQMSADGAIHALTYARPTLSRIRRKSVAIVEDGELPDVPRGGAIDQAITRLIADVDTAREWYGDQVQEAAERSPFPETATMAGSPDLKALAGRAHKVAEDTAAIGDELADGATPGSVAADNLQRRVRDVAVLSRQEGIELAAPQPRPRLIDQLNQGIKDSVPWVKAGLRAVRVGADFAQIGIERFSNILTRQITVVCEEVAGFARDIELRLQHYETEFAPSSPPPAAPAEASEPPAPPGGDGVVILRSPEEWIGLPDLTVFKHIDAPWCPEMVVIPRGSFPMGSAEDDEEGTANERPQHRVEIGYRLAIGRHPVTFEEYDLYCASTGMEEPGDEGWGRGRRPVIDVSWYDAQDHVRWLSGLTGAPYGLPSEAEWEYACRAGTTTRYWWGNRVSKGRLNYGGHVGKTTEVGQYQANPWGLFDTLGNVWEWVQDHWHEDYIGAPLNGSAWIDRPAHENAHRVNRGGSWFYLAWNARSACRDANHPGSANDALGFRLLLRSIEPGQD